MKKRKLKQQLICIEENQALIMEALAAMQPGSLTSTQAKKLRHQAKTIADRIAAAEKQQGKPK